MKKLARFFLVLSLIISSGCHKAKNTPPTEDRIDKATLMIDRSEYDSAIELLEDSIQNYEDTPKTRLVLASAYAARAGVKVENYWDYLVGYDVFTKTQTDDEFAELIPAHRIPENLKDEDKKQILVLNGYFKDFQRLEKKAAKIPLVEKSQRNDIYRAREILKSVDAPNARLYRSLLTAVAAKSEIAEGNQVVRSWVDSKPHLCENAMPELADWLMHVLNLISDGLNDLGVAYPDENESYQVIRHKIKNGIEITQQLQNQKKNLENLCQLKR